VKPLPLEEIRRAVGGRWLKRGEPVTVSNVCTDTRLAQPDDLFMALRGERFDGHGFLRQAGKAGCAAAVVRRGAEPPPEVTSLFCGGIIGVMDTTKALGDLGAYHRRALPVTAVAVTGSNGKTTVKGMVHHILSRRFRGTCSPKSYNNAIGVPKTLLGMSPGDDYVVCELGSNSPGEIAPLSKMVAPSVAVITNISETHLEGFHKLERVAAEKASVLEGLTEPSLAVVWADSDLLRRTAGSYGKRAVFFGAGDRADLRITGYEPSPGGQSFQLNGRHWVSLPLVGRHNALNATAAIAVAQRYGFEQGEAVEALADFEPVEMRLQRVEAGEVAILNDAYNSNPAALLAACDVLLETPAGRRVLVAGDMLELGERAEELHARCGREIAAKGVDLVIGIGTLGGEIASAAEEGAETARFESVEEAGAELAGMLKAGDVVLIKGSRAVQMERLVEPIRETFAGKRGRRKRSTSKGSRS